MQLYFILLFPTSNPDLVFRHKLSRNINAEDSDDCKLFTTGKECKYQGHNLGKQINITGIVNMWNNYHGNLKTM